MEDRMWLAGGTLLMLISSAWGAYALGARRPVSNWGNYLLIFLSFLAHTWFLYLRGNKIGHCPLSNLFETTAFLSWSLLLTYLLIGSAYRFSILGSFTSPLVFLMNFFALILPVDEPRAWRLLGWKQEMHASLSVLAYGAFGIAALAGLMYLIQEHQLKRRDLHNWFYNLPAMGELEVVHRRLLWWGFLLLSGGLAMGLQLSFSTQWDWVKLGWAGGVWLLYATLLIAPRFWHWSQKRVAWLSLTGYAFVLLTFWGINSLSHWHKFDL